MMAETALTLDEVAQFLKVSPQTVRRLAAKGELPGRKIGNKWRFSPLAIHLWLAGDSVPKSAHPHPYQRGVETLPIEIARLLLKVIMEQPHYTPSESEETYGTSGVKKKTGNPHLDFFGCLASNPLAQEVEDLIQAEKGRERQIAQSENL